MEMYKVSLSIIGFYQVIKDYNHMHMPNILRGTLHPSIFIRFINVYKNFENIIHIRLDRYTAME